MRGSFVPHHLTLLIGYNKENDRVIKEHSISRVRWFLLRFMLIDDKLLNKVSEQAKASPRLRMNYNLHETLDDKVQRLFNAMEPGTIIPIQRHQDTAETMIVVRGKLRITIYDDFKNIIEQCVLNPLDGNYGYHIPKGVWHGVEVLVPNTVMFEVKEGPYAPLGPEDILN